jgi:hypothetical protein
MGIKKREEKYLKYFHSAVMEIFRNEIKIKKKKKYERRLLNSFETLFQFSFIIITIKYTSRDPSRKK